MNYPVRMGECGNIFHIGTIKNPKNLDSHRWRDKWSVNCINHWAATLGQELNEENAIHNHLVVVLHELTHVGSGISRCKISWDEFLDRTLKEIEEVKK